MSARPLLSVLAWIVATIAPLAATVGQEPAPAMPDGPDNVFAPGPDGPTQTDEEKQREAQRKQEHLQKIQQLTFDRRPSAILKAWSTPPGEEDEDESEAAATGSAAALPAPEVEGFSEEAVVVSAAPVVMSRSLTITRSVGVAATAVAPTAIDEAVIVEEASTPTPAPAAEVASASEAQADTFDDDLKTFQRSVTLGDWDAAGAFIATLPEDEAKALYTRLVQVLPNPPQVQPEMVPVPGGPPGAMMATQVNPMFAEKNVISHADVVAIAGIAPVELDDDLLASLGGLVNAALQQGHAIDDLLERVRAVLEGPEDDRPLDRRDVAKLLMGANHAVEAGDFLPTLDEAEATDDREALNLLSRHFLAEHAREPKSDFLERAWRATLAVLAAGEVDAKQKDEALTRAVELATQIRHELGRDWLVRSFTDRPERGMEILAAIGKAAAQGLQSRPHDVDSRKRTLELQQESVEALLANAPERADAWREPLELLALAWLTEAEHSRRYDTSTSLGPRMMRDPFGNFYFAQSYGDDGQPMMMMNQDPNMPRPLTVADVLKVKPGEDWLGRIADALRPEFSTVFARLYLKVGEEDEAFPYIERLAATHPELATDLAEEFLRVWTRNHDPNAARSYTNPYYFMYGFERRAESIPLTRSKQERNLEELSKWVARLEALPIGDLDERLLANAFTTCHSAAEVYRIEAIEEVFGSMDDLDPETLAMLVQQMRGNLNGVWRLPATQETAKTRRREQDIRAEVMRGYDVARGVVARGLELHPGHHALIQAGAAVDHDLNNYLQELETDPSFTPRRQAALDEFRAAAEAYAAEVPDLSEEEESIEVYEQWFAASLGAVDLGDIKEEHLLAADQPALIREAIESLPGAAAERHKSMFANALFTRMSSIGPALKFRYLKAGFEIVGDHEQAHEARKVYDYYHDLVTELKLDAHVDGSTDVGSGAPFGLFVDLRHTREIERESGGFGRYLQNQNTGTSYYYNYGRPLENYRDKFEEATRNALNEHFIVHSVTFQSEDVNSRATEEYGWRVTPYAYVLLEARGPEIDTIPPLRLDLDFLDTSGYVVLPIESPPMPIDAAVRDEPRPYEKLEVTQTLDERQADEGVLLLEIKGVAQGLVPDLDTLLDIGSDGFEVAEVEDQGLSIARFDPEAEGNVIVSERSWLVTMKADDVEAGIPRTFHFASLNLDDGEAVYQRYNDADLAEVGPVIDLEERYGERTYGWAWYAVPLGVLALLIAAVFVLRPRAPTQADDRFTLPDQLTPFTVLGLLREIERANGLPAPQQQELVATIGRLETHYFVGPDGPDPDLRDIAERWVRVPA